MISAPQFSQRVTSLPAVLSTGLISCRKQYDLTALWDMSRISVILLYGAPDCLISVICIFCLSVIDISSFIYQERPEHIPLPFSIPPIQIEMISVTEFEGK